MKLKLKIDSLEEAAEGTEGFYVENEDGTYSLEVEGAPKDLSEDVSKLNKSLQAERAAHKATKSKFSWVGELTRDEVQELKDAKEDLEHKLEDGKSASESEIEERAERLAARQTRKLQQTIDSLTSEVNNHREAISLHEAAGAQRKIKDAVESSLSAKDALAVVDSAREDIVPFAERIMHVNEEGEVVTRDGVGFEPGLPFAEVLADLQSSGRRSHWFKGSEGTGASGNDGGSNTHAGPNPFSKETFSLTEIAQIKRENPRRALALCKAAKENPAKFGINEAA